MPSRIKDKNTEQDLNEADTSYLLSYTRHLERQKKRLETEKQVVEGERLRLQRELNNLRTELERLRAPPLFTGQLVEVLDKQTAVIRSTTGPTMVVSISSRIDRKLLQPNVRVALNQRSFAIVDVLPESHDPMVRAMEIEERPQVSYEDIGGLKDQIEELREIVELPLKSPELFEQIGIEPPKGVLLHGPPGTGKTLLARAVAHETEARFIRVIGSELVQKFIGEGARLVREIFRFAEEHTPTILFIDELDAIGSKRLDMGTSGDREVQRTLMQLLSCLDGFEPRGDVKVIAATNRPDILDSALVRPGRFDRIIEVPLPGSEGRLEIFKVHTRRISLANDVDLAALADMTENFSGAEIKNVCMEAGILAVRERLTSVKHKHFVEAVKKVKRRQQKDQFATSQFFS